MSYQSFENLKYIEGDIQSDTNNSPSPIPNYIPIYKGVPDNFMSATPCTKNPENTSDTQSNINQHHIELNSSSYMNGHQTHQMLIQNPIHYQEVKDAESESTSSIPLSNRQYSPSNKQYYQQLTPPYGKIEKNFADENSDSLNKSSNTKTNKRDDLEEFELLEQQVNNMQSDSTKNEKDLYQVSQNQKFNSNDNVTSNHTDSTAREILNAAATPIQNVSQAGGGDKMIKMKPTLKKNYMSLEQLQMKCQINQSTSNQANSNILKNDLYNINSQDIKHDIDLQHGNQNLNRLYTVSDTNDYSDFFNKYNMANSESIDQQPDSLYQLLDRAFQSKIKYEQLNSNEQHVVYPQKPQTPVQLEKQILGNLPPPSPINMQNLSGNNHFAAPKLPQAKDPNNKIQLQFSNILESLKKNNSMTTLVSSHTTGSKSNSQQNCSTAQSKSGNKTPSSGSNLTTLIYQNDANEKILIEGEYDPSCSSQVKSLQPRNSTQLSSLSRVYTSLGDFNLNPESHVPEQSGNKQSNNIPTIAKSQSHANFGIHSSNQQRSISLSTAQDYQNMLNRRRNSRRMSSKGSIASSVDSRGKNPDQMYKDIKELNAYFNHYDQDKNGFEESTQLAKSGSQKRIPSKSASTLLLRMDQDLERRRVNLQEQLKQKEMKSSKNLEDYKRQNNSRGKLSKDEEKSLVNKLFDDANRRQNIQVMQQKMKKIEEEQREQRSLEAQRESIMKKNSSIHNSSLYANVQSKIKSIIESKPSLGQESTSLQRTQASIMKHSYSKKNQNRTISPILKRTQKPLEKSDSKTQLNKTQLALQQFQNKSKLENQYASQNIQQTNGHHQSSKSQNFIDNLQFQFYTPAKPLNTESKRSVKQTLNKDTEGTKSSKQLLNNSQSSKPSYLKLLSNSKVKTEYNFSKDPTPHHKKDNSIVESTQLQSFSNSCLPAPPSSISQMKKSLTGVKSNLRLSYDMTSQQQKKQLPRNDSFVNKENGQKNSKSLTRKPKITINIDEEEEYENYQQQQQQKQFVNINNHPKSTSKANEKHLTSITPSKNSIAYNHQNSTQQQQQHNSSSQNNSGYVSMKNTNSFFREKNPSTLSSTNQNFLKLNRQMQYQYTSGNMTSKNSSFYQSQQQSMKNSILYPSKTPSNNQNKKSAFSFVNQCETSMDDQQFLQSRQMNSDTIKINIAQSKAQLLENNYPIRENNFLFEQQQQQQIPNQGNQQKQEKVDNINKFITDNPNFIQFMIQQYNQMQTNNFNPQLIPPQMQQQYINQQNYVQQQQQYYSQQSMPVNPNNNRQNKVLTVDDLLDLDSYNNTTDGAPSKDLLDLQTSSYPSTQQQNQQFQLISMQEIDQTPINLLQFDQNSNYMMQQQPQQSQVNQQNSFLNYQMQNGFFDESSSKSFGSFQNLGQNGQAYGKNVKYNGHNTKQQIKSGSSLEYQDNELIEQNFQSANNLNPAFKSSNTIPSSNCIGNNISSNSAIEQHFTNLTYLQKSNSQFMNFNNNNNNNNHNVNSMNMHNHNNI